jgi:hypothetical protein
MKVNNSTKPSAKISLKNESQQFHKAQLEKKFKIWESTIPQSPARKKFKKWKSAISQWPAGKNLKYAYF